MMETHNKVATPRILYLTEFWPHRTTIGAELRSLHVLRALEQLGTVEVVVLDETGTGNDQVPTSPGKFKVAPPVKLKNRSTRGLIGKLNWMLNPRIHYPHGCGVDEDGTHRILSSIKDFDLVWFFKWRTPNMFPYAPWPRSVLDIDDVPSTYVRTTLQREPGFWKRFLARSRVWSWSQRGNIRAWTRKCE